VDDESLRKRLMHFFKPALLARMQVVPYRYLDESVLADIIDARLARLIAQFAERYEATLTIDESARAELRARCIRHENGARMLDASIDGELLPPLSLSVLQRMASGEPFAEAALDWKDNAFSASLH
jgi:type VI secretion system protein VasG